MPKTILLADDSVTIQKVVGISFANEDVVLLTVDNGDDAVTRAREAAPDLVLADVMMPGKDGYEVCETLKGDPDLRHVPVLLLSGTFEPFDEERARRAGADGHITKPFEAQALVDQVNALLARAAARPPEMAAAGDATRSAGGPTDAFDFFEEEMAQTTPSPLGAPASGLFDGARDELAPLELEASVEDDEPMMPPPRTPEELSGGFGRPAAADTQATVLFGEAQPAMTLRSPTPPFLGDGFEAESLATPAAPTPSLPALPEADAPAGYEESFDFGFEDAGESAAPVITPPEPIARESIAQPVPLAPTRLFGEDDIEEPVEAMPEPVHTLPPLPPAPSLAPPPVPVLAPPPVPTPVSSSAASTPAPASTPVAVRVSGPDALSEPIQKQLQETLEKVVWEAFGDLSERIVRDVLERVEAVAWEVIPQLAETLIREEIRQLKDGEES